MHLNPNFRKTPEARNIAFVQDRSFGALAVNAPDGPLISHIPFLLSDDGKHLEAHLVRSNPIVRLLGQERKAVISVVGGDAYISPDWYGVEDQVPTWNYVAVHLRGTLRISCTDKLRGVLDRISADMERRLLPKTPWKIDKMTPEVFEKMARQIVAIELDVAVIDGTWKLSQNKPKEAVAGAVDGLQKSDVGAQIDTIIHTMKSENDI